MKTMIIIIAVLVSFIPSLLMFFFLRNNRKDDEEYRSDCVKLLFGGLAICGLVMLFDLLIKIPWNMIGIGKKYPMIDRAFTCFVVNATVEEIAKFLYGKKYIDKNKVKASRLDIISFLTISAISFGLLEDVVYVFGSSIGHIIIRGVLMGHVPEQLLMGYFYGKSIAEKKPVYKVLAFVLPILIHGTYNFLLSDGLPDWTAMVEIALVLAEMIYIIRMIFFIKKKRTDYEYTRPVFVDE